MSAPAEIARESVLAIGGQLPLLAALVAAAAAAVACEALLVPRLPASGRALVRWAVLLGAVGGGLWLAWSKLWLCDDAYISFRYSRNLADGLGLVYNAGERVEGYTNFLWTALLGGLAWLGADIPMAALSGNLASFVLALVVTAEAVRRTAPASPGVPFAALALAGSTAFATYASSGLETMPVALLVAAAVLAGTARPASARLAPLAGPLLSSLCLVAAALSRPDHVLLWAAMGGAWLVEDLVHGEGPVRARVDVRRVLAYAAPLVLVFVPYWLVRWHAYGDFFPNTYHAKSGGSAYVRQGLVYATHFVGTTGAWLWLPLLAFAATGRRRTRDETRVRAFALLGVALLGTYVVRVGGDFMQHRFLLSLLPPVAIALELALRFRLAQARESGAHRQRVALGAAGALALAAAVLPVAVVKPYEKRWHLAAEESFYRVTKLSPLEIDSPYWAEARLLEKVLVRHGLRPKIGTSSTGIIGYYTGLPIVDAYGLTSRRIARKPVVKRDRPGHEKFATLDDFLAEGVVLDAANRWGDEWRDQTRIAADGLELYLLRWDPELARKLAKLPGARVPSPQVDAKKLAANGDRDRVVEALRFYRRFVAGTPLADRIEAPLVARLGEVADFEGALPAGASTRGSMRLGHGKRPPGTAGEGWLTSLPDEDDGRGEATIQIASLRGPELRLVVSGKASPGIAVRLEVEGAVAREARPAGPRPLPVAWDVAELAGRPAVLRIVDDDPAPGAGILVDSIHEPGPGDVRGRLGRAAEGLPGTALADAVREAERQLPPDDPALVAAIAALPARFRLDEGPFPEGSDVGGTAFGAGPAGGAIGEQGRVRGFHGAGFANSYHGGDAAKGRLALPEVVLGGGNVHVLVGGGSDCKRTYVGVEVAGKVVSRACGKDDELLRPVTLDVRRFAGQAARIVVVDDATDEWGHVLADDPIVGLPPVRAVPGANPVRVGPKAERPAPKASPSTGPRTRGTD